MDSAHRTLKNTDRTLAQPDSVTKISYCTYTGMRATSSCPSSYYYCDKDSLPDYCNLKHTGGTSGSDEVQQKKPSSGSQNDSSNNDEDDTEESTTRRTTERPHPVVIPGRLREVTAQRAAALRAVLGKNDTSGSGHSSTGSSGSGGHSGSTGTPSLTQ